jgi:hypothetical protein
MEGEKNFLSENIATLKDVMALEEITAVVV